MGSIQASVEQQAPSSLEEMIEKGIAGSIQGSVYLGSDVDEQDLIEVEGIPVEADFNDQIEARSRRVETGGYISNHDVNPEGGLGNSKSQEDSAQYEIIFDENMPLAQSNGIHFGH